MNITREYLEQQVTDLGKQKEQAVAQLNVIIGAELEAKAMLARCEATEEVPPADPAVVPQAEPQA